MRVLLVALLLVLASRAGLAFDDDQLWQEFDARVLTAQEKRLLQAGLAFDNFYNGMIDGAWGPASQRALERSVIANGGTDFVSNADAVLVAVNAYSALEAEGWERQYQAALDMSFLVPTDALLDGSPSETFVNWNVDGRTIRYSLAISDGAQGGLFHQNTADLATGEVYTVRRPEVWITSARTSGGIRLYTRSDYRGGSWSTILVSGEDQDAGALAAITGSIAPGYAPAVGMSPGLLENGINTLAALVTDGEGGSGANPGPLPGGSGGADVELTTAFGTGFLVSASGHVLTNHHVVTGCSALSVGALPATLLAQDATFDLALLQVEASASDVPAVFADDPARLNSDVTVAGYPLPDLLGGLNVTRGSVTSLKGLGGDGINMQISAPVQAGNSGGPVINASGLVVGVVVAKLDEAVVTELYGDTPQNVNFAIRGEIAKLFLSQNGVNPIIAASGSDIAPEILADWAQGFTRLITCN